MKNIFITLITLYSINLFSQSSSASTHQFFVHLDGIVPIDTLESYLADLNSTEIWQHSYSGLALWQVSGYPFTMANGTVVYDINTVIRQSVKKTKISEATLNIFTSLGDINDNSTGSCFDPLQYSIAQGSSRNVKIAILDTGVSPSMSQSTTGNLNYNLTSYVGHDYVNNDNVPNDDNGHGTHIAGIIHSITNGVDSLGNKVDFYIYKTHNSSGQALMSNVVKGLIDAVDNNVDIVNMSFGLQDTFHIDSFFPLRTAIQFALDKKVLVIAAAGNNGVDIDNHLTTAMPAGFPENNLISVSAIGCNDSLTTFSNYGINNTDIAALGYKIPGPDMVGGLKYSSGTSQATAIVSAVAALVATYQNNFKVENIKCALTNGDSNINGMIGKSLYEGKINPSTAKNKYQNLVFSYNVTNNSNSGTGSLRNAIEDVCGVENISFSAATNNQTINISGKPVLLQYDIGLTGNGITNTMLNGQNIPILKIGYNANISLGNINFTHINSTQGSILNKGNLVITNTVKIE